MREKSCTDCYRVEIEVACLKRVIQVTLMCNHCRKPRSKCTILSQFRPWLNMEEFSFNVLKNALKNVLSKS